MHRTKKILVAPLNWGLGHATRCIPLIREFQRQGAEVMLASDGRARSLLLREFPDMPVLPLPGYGIRYQTNSMLLNMARHLPGLIKAIWREQKIIEKYTKTYGLQGIVSDNRLGCYSRHTPSVYLTHQIRLILPGKLLEQAARLINYHFIGKYRQCWVPDTPGEINLSGPLSHHTPIQNMRYIGALSRMQYREMDKIYDVIAVLSGPEPQRNLLEKKIVDQARSLRERFLIVQGKPEKNERYSIGKNIEVVSCLNSKELNLALLQSKLFLGRSGYSSIMDLAKVRIPALLIPTPGQTEQEFLAEDLYRKNVFLRQKQEELDLATGLPYARQFHGLDDRFFNDHLLQDAVKSFLQLN